MVVTLFLRMRKSRPFTCLVMIPFLRSRMVFQLRVTVAHAFDAMLGGIFQVVINLRVEQQGLGGNATPVQAGAPQFLFTLDQGNLQPVLPGADGGGVSTGAAANDDYVVDCFCHRMLPRF